DRRCDGDRSGRQCAGRRIHPPHPTRPASVTRTCPRSGLRLPGRALEIAAQAGPMAQPLVDYAKEAFVNGSSQATLTLAILTAAAAVLLAILAPGTAPRDHKTTA